MPDPQKILAYLTKLGLTAFAFFIAGELILEELRCLLRVHWMTIVIGILLMIPIAYFILESGRPRSERRPHRGAERTPLLPPHEEH